MGFPAARLGDPHTCPMVNAVSPGKKGGICEDDVPPVNDPHVGGPILGDGSPDVFVNGKKAARTGDNASCQKAPVLDLLVTGASDVLINGRLAAVQGSKTFHKGEVVAKCSEDVNMGTALAGATFGDSAAATKACEEASEKRSKYKDTDYLGNTIPPANRDRRQGKGMNCGQESVRQICIQKCREAAQAGGKPCGACNETEDGWYKKYMQDEQSEHNKVNEEYRKEVERQNEDVWNNQVLKAGCASTERLKGAFDPKTKSWTDYEGQTLYLWSSDKISVNNSPKAIVFIKKRPSKIEDPAADANKGEIGSFPETRQDMLKKACGVDSTLGKNDEQSLASDVANGKTVIATVDVGTLNGNPPQGNHAVTVTQMKFDDQGNLVEVTLNDTGNPNSPGSANGVVCGRVMKGQDLQNFQRALVPGTQTNVV